MELEEKSSSQPSIHVREVQVEEDAIWYQLGPRSVSVKNA